MPTPDVAEAVTIEFGAAPAMTPVSGDIRLSTAFSVVTTVAPMTNGGFIYVMDDKLVVVSASGEVLSELAISNNGSITARPGGGFIVLGDGGVGYMLDAAGAIVDDFAVYGINGQVTSLQDGGWLVMSANGVDRYDADGTHVANRVIGGQSFGRDIATLNDGKYVVIYMNGISRPGFLLFDADGGFISNYDVLPENVPGFGNANAIAALAGGGWVIATHNGHYATQWQFAIYDSNGQHIRSELQDAPDGVPAEGRGLDVIGLPDGGFLVTWIKPLGDGDGDAVMAQRFDAAGNPIGDIFRAAEMTEGNQRSTSFEAGSTSTVLSDGRVLLAFATEHGPGQGVYYRLFDTTTAFNGFRGGSDIPLPITLSPLDPGETIEQIRLSGVPTGVVLSAGTLQPDGSWIVAEAQTRRSHA